MGSLWVQFIFYTIRLWYYYDHYILPPLALLFSFSGLVVFDTVGAVDQTDVAVVAANLFLFTNRRFDSANRATLKFHGIPHRGWPEKAYVRVHRHLVIIIILLVCGILLIQHVFVSDDTRIFECGGRYIGHILIHKIVKITFIPLASWPVIIITRLCDPHSMGIIYCTERKN